MAARIGPGFENEDLFLAYCRSHGVAAAYGTYRSCMNTMAAHLSRRLTSSMLRSESDVEKLTADVLLTPFNRAQHSNFRSVLRKYVEMIRSNYEGKFDNIIPVGIDVEEDQVPPRILTEISRVVRDTVTARALKRRYDGKCQVCGNCLQISPGEFYLEAHHLKPLGARHKGPDVERNLICVCPNCHALLDFNAIRLSVQNLKVCLHAIGKEFIEYHNEHCR